MKNYTWEDVTIQQYNEILAVSQMKIDDLDKCLHVLSVLTGIEYEDYLNYPITEIEKEVKQIIGITSGKPKPRFDGKGIYQVNGKKYKLTLSAKHMTAGQFIDYNNTIATNADDIAMLCAIFLIPDGKKYAEDYDVLELRDEINEHFKIVDAMGISFFFLKSYEALYGAILRSLLRTLKREKKKLRTSPKKMKVIEESISMIQYHIPGSGSTNKLFNIRS